MDVKEGIKYNSIESCEFCILLQHIEINDSFLQVLPSLYLSSLISLWSASLEQ